MEKQSIERMCERERVNVLRKKYKPLLVKIGKQIKEINKEEK